MLATRNMAGERHDLWAVNVDDEYLEESSEKVGAVSVCSR